MRYFLLAVLLVVINFQYSFADVQPEPGSGYVKKKMVQSDKFMVVSANELATKAGVEIINNGGNAIDAAIAVQMVLNVVEPQSSGIGGGGFLLYYDAEEKTITSFDGREKAPENIDTKLFIKPDGEAVDFFDAVKGGKSVGVPGLLAMLKSVHEKYGKMEWGSLFERAIIIAESSFAVSPRLYKVANSVSYINEFDKASSIFLDKEGEVKKVGAVIYNQELADIFKVIAKDGGYSFYKGGIAENIVETVSQTKINPGYLSLSDMANYVAVQRDAVCVNYRDYKVCGMAPPSSGGISIGQALGVLQEFDISAGGERGIHLILEATKLAFADRNKFVADNDFVEIPLVQMLDDGYLKKRASLINENSAEGIYQAGNLSDQYGGNGVSNEPPSTTHISIVDKNGNAVSLTSSIEHAFGSVLMTNGFLLNNQLTDFSFRDEVAGLKVANRIEGGKRPRSSMSPTIILDKDDKLYMIIGSPGGSNIIPYVLKTIVGVIDWNMDIQQAIDMPNFVNKNTKTTYVEKGRFPSGLADFLYSIGHSIEEKHLNSGLHGIVIKDGIIYGGADPRREGVAIGG